MALFSAPVEAQHRRWVPVSGKSVVGFDASFPLGNFSGQTADLVGEFVLDPADLRLGVAGTLGARAASLRTGLDARDRDMWALLEVDRYREIRFTVQRAEASFHSVTDRADVLLTITGVMLMRGVERLMVFSGRVRSREGSLWARGEAPLRMTDVGIRPPRRLFFSVEDQVTLRFDLTLAPAE